MDRNAVDIIIKSQKSIKGINLSIKAEFFGVAWAASNDCDKERYNGQIAKWKSKKDFEVYIKWEGWDGNKAARLDQLVGEDENGDSVECQLHDYDDGTAAPVYQEPAAEAAETEVWSKPIEAMRARDCSSKGGGGRQSAIALSRSTA